jgi:hypothetical protein
MPEDAHHQEWQAVLVFHQAILPDSGAIVYKTASRMGVLAAGTTMAKQLARTMVLAVSVP